MFEISYRPEMDQAPLDAAAAMYVDPEIPCLIDFLKRSASSTALGPDPKRTRVNDFLKRSASSNDLTVDPKKPREASLDAAACMDSASLKRRASSDALDEDPKRPIDPDSASDYDYDSDSHSDSYSYSPLPKLGYFAGESCFVMLTSNVENEPELKLMATEIIQSVKYAVNNPEHLKTLAAQVKTMLKCPLFVQAFVKANDEGPYMLACIEEYRKNAADDQERFKNLQEDTTFQNVLRDMENTDKAIGGVLKIIMAYWSDEDLYNDLVNAIKIHRMEKYPERAKPAKPKVDLPVTMESIIDIDYPATIEGLKDLLRTKYDDYVYKRLCDSVDSNKSEIERNFWPNNPNDRLIGIVFFLGVHDFSVNIVGCGVLHC